MTTQISISGDLGLWPGRSAPSAPYELERALDNFLKGDGEVTWDRDEHRGTGWYIDLLLHDDADIDGWVRRLTAFLRQWGVPDGPLSFSIVREEGGAGVEHRWVVVPGDS